MPRRGLPGAFFGEELTDMRWTRSETLALAAPACASCHGGGLLLGRRGSAPCNCVLRAIFRVCYSRFRECATKEKFMSRMTLEYSGGQDSKASWGRKDEE